jgi:hypothetical protein
VIYFPVGSAGDCSISEIITSKVYVIMSFYHTLPGISVSLLQGACAFLWLDNITHTGKKDLVLKIFGECTKIRWQRMFRVKVLLMRT